MGLGILLFIASIVTSLILDFSKTIILGSGAGALACLAIAAFITRAVLRSHAILISANAHIVHNTRVSANIALFEASKKYSKYEDDKKADDKTKMSKPQKKAEIGAPQSYENSQIESDDILEDCEEDDEDDDSEYVTASLPQKKCPKCGTKHDFDYPQCPKCKFSYYK